MPGLTAGVLTKNWTGNQKISKIVMERQNEIVEKLLISVIEHWNENNPDTKIDADFLAIIRNHIDYGYVIGVEDTFRLINKQFKRYYPKCDSSISHVLIKGILDHKNY